MNSVFVFLFTGLFMLWLAWKWPLREREWKLFIKVSIGLGASSIMASLAILLVVYFGGE